MFNPCVRRGLGLRLNEIEFLHQSRRGFLRRVSLAKYKGVGVELAHVA